MSYLLDTPVSDLNARFKRFQPFALPLLAVILMLAFLPGRNGEEAQQPVSGQTPQQQQQQQQQQEQPSGPGDSTSGDAPGQGLGATSPSQGEAATADGQAAGEGGGFEFERADPGGDDDRGGGSGFSPGGSGGGQDQGERELRCEADDDLPEPVVGPTIEQLEEAEAAIEEERGEPLPAPLSATLMQEANCQYEMAEALPTLFVLSQTISADNPFVVAAAAPALEPGCSFAGHLAVASQAFGMNLQPVLIDSIELCAAVDALNGDGSPQEKVGVLDEDADIGGDVDADDPTGVQP